MKPNKPDSLIEKSFGKLTVVRYLHSDKHKRRTYECVCQCGRSTVTTGIALRSGKTKSCGCLLKEYYANGASATHKKSKTRLYRVWASMKDRCGNPRTPGYRNYGERGITVCNSWIESFENFYAWAMSNGYKDGLTLDREDNNGNYNPNNCRWVTHQVQCNNTRRTRRITAKGETMSIAQWARRFGIHPTTINSYVNSHSISYEEYMSMRMKGEIAR